MKHKSILLVGSVFLLGVIELTGETFFAETILNPLNPVEEITPKDPEVQSVEQSDVEIRESEQVEAATVEEEQPVEKKEVKPSSDDKTPTLKKNDAREKYRIEDIFSSPKAPALALPSNVSGGGEDDQVDYCVQMYSLMTGLLLYGKKVGGTTYHVHDVFR